MSASREIICEKISECEIALTVAESELRFEDASRLNEELTNLKRQLFIANKNLSEGKSILKG